MHIKLFLSGLVLVAAATPLLAATPSRDTATCYVTSSHGNCASAGRNRRAHAKKHWRRTVHYQNPAWYYDDHRRTESAPVYAANNPPPPPPPDYGNSAADYAPPYPPGGPTFNFYGPTQNFFGPTTNYFGPGSQGAYAPAPDGRDDDRLDPWRHYDHRNGIRNGY